MWNVPPPGRIKRLTPQNVHLICFGALLPGYPASVHDEIAKEFGIQNPADDREEGLESPLLNDALRQLQAKVIQGRPTAKDKDHCIERAKILFKVFRGLPLEPYDKESLIESELAIDDFQESCRIAAQHENVKAPFRQPLVQTSFPAVGTKDSIGFVGRWQVFAPHRQERRGRVAFALSSPGTEFGCWSVNNLADDRTRGGFYRAVKAARQLAKVRLGQEELDDLIVWLEPEPALPLDEHVSQADLPCLWDQPRNLGGASGSLALAVALLQAWTGERLDLRNLLITGDITDEGQIAAVGEPVDKARLEKVSNRILDGFFKEVGSNPNTKPPQNLADYWHSLVNNPDRQRGGIKKMLDFLEHLHKGSLPNSAFPTSTINFVKVTKVEKKPEPVKPIDQNSAKTDDIEQDEIIQGEETKRIGFAEFSQLVLSTKYSLSSHPVILTAGPGMGKTFASCRLAIEQCKEWLKSDPQSKDQKPALPLWVSLSQLNSLTPEALFEAALAPLKLTSVEKQGLEQAFAKESLLVVLDARDQGDEVAKGEAIRRLSDQLLSSRPPGKSLHLLVTTRPIRRSEVWANFGAWQTGCFELRQADSTSKDWRAF